MTPARTLPHLTLRWKLILGACLMTAATAGLGLLSLHHAAIVAHSVTVTTQQTTPLLSDAVRLAEMANRISVQTHDEITDCLGTRTAPTKREPIDARDFETRLERLRETVAETEFGGLAINLSLNGLAQVQILADVETICDERRLLLSRYATAAAQAREVAFRLQFVTKQLALLLEGDVSGGEEAVKVGAQTGRLDGGAIRAVLIGVFGETWPTLRSLYRLEALSYRVFADLDLLAEVNDQDRLAETIADHDRLQAQMEVLSRRLVPRLRERFQVAHAEDVDAVVAAIARLGELASSPEGLYAERRRLIETAAVLEARARVADGVDRDIRSRLAEIEGLAKRADETARERMTSAIADARMVVGSAVIGIGMIAFVLAVLYARILSGPVEALSRHAVRLRDDPDLDNRLPESLMRRNDEIGSLARAFDDMVRSLAAARKALLDDTRRQIARQAERLSKAFETLPLGLYMLDADGAIVLANHRIAEMYDFEPMDCAGGTPVRVLLERRFENGYGPVGTSIETMTPRVVKSGALERTVEHLSDGRVVVVTVAPSGDGGSLVVHEDITERYRAERQISHLARHDPLTGLPNRSEFRENLAQEFDRLPEGRRIALLFLDLDQFKSVNDTLGHPVGDRLLTAVARRLRSQLSEDDHLARLGGDEFAVILSDDPRPEKAADAAERIIEALGRPFDVDGHHIAIGVSVGISIAPDDAQDEDRLVKNADMALYRAKREGRGTHRFFEAEMDRLMQFRRALELDLRKAIVDGEMELYYQPLFGLDGNHIAGFEALLRWHHPTRGMVSPVEFIPLAEETGLIGQIGAWVLKRACLDAAAWPASVRVAVNISPVQFRGRALVLDVMAALGASGLGAERLELEITEGVLLHDTEATLQTLGQLRTIGVRIAMDDFGTGYSSLSYLRKFAFDKVKIDQSFIRELGDAPDCLAIVRAVTGLCESLGITTTAEGVETEEQLETLRREGCTQVQGFLFGRPMPLSSVRARLEQFGVGPDAGSGPSIGEGVDGRPARVA